jgi:hypothetical protein
MVTCPVIPRLQPAYERIISTLRGCSGSQVVLALLRAGHPIGHVCLIRDGSFEDAAQLPPARDGDGRGKRVPPFM